MLAAPTTHFVLLRQAILYRGAGLSVVWRQFLALAAIGTVLFAFCCTASARPSDRWHDKAVADRIGRAAGKARQARCPTAPQQERPRMPRGV